MAEKVRKQRDKDAVMPDDFWHYPFNPITGYHTESNRSMDYYRKRAERHNGITNDRSRV